MVSMYRYDLCPLSVRSLKTTIHVCRWIFILDVAHLRYECPHGRF
jgi:hypothetical protein